MADKKLESITFPDLPDRYVVKPDIADVTGLQTALDGKADAEDVYNGFVSENIQGSIASFDDGADDIPVKSLVADIVPLQSGSGDPSPDNVRAITGWTEANANVAGCAVTNNTTDYIELPFPIENGESYAFCNVGHLGADLTLYDENKSQVDWWAVTAAYPNENQKTNNYNKTIKYIRARNTNGKPIAIRNVTKGQSYDITTHTISFASAGTVYGGRLDVTSGVLTVEWEMVDLGTLTYTLFSADTFYAIVSGKKNGFGNAICSNYATMQQAGVGNLLDKHIVGENGGKAVYIKDSTYSGYTIAQFKTAMNGVKLAYELATPQTYQLTPTEVKTLLGNNNVWADTGDIDLTYRADLGLYLDKIINA